MPMFDWLSLLSSSPVGIIEIGLREEPCSFLIVLTLILFSSEHGLIFGRKMIRDVITVNFYLPFIGLADRTPIQRTFANNGSVSVDRDVASDFCLNVFELRVVNVYCTLPLLHVLFLEEWVVATDFIDNADLLLLLERSHLFELSVGSRHARLE